jgi:hypothetical protein
VITSGDTVETGDRGFHVTPPSTEYSKFVTADPPSEAGPANTTDNRPSPGLTRDTTGADGTVTCALPDAKEAPSK